MTDKESPNVLPVTTMMAELQKLLKQGDWQSASIVATAISDKLKKEDLYISDREKALLGTVMDLPDANATEPGLLSDGFPDDSARDPETGIPYGDLT